MRAIKEIYNITWGYFKNLQYIKLKNIKGMGKFIDSVKIKPGRTQQPKQTLKIMRRLKQ